MTHIDARADGADPPKEDVARRSSKCNTTAVPVDHADVDILHLPTGQSIVVRLRDLYREDERDFGHQYRRLLGVLRLARSIEDQLSVSGDVAAVLASALLGVRADA